jgi:hypothetical protein
MWLDFSFSVFPKLVLRQHFQMGSRTYPASYPKSTTLLLGFKAVGSWTRLTPSSYKFNIWIFTWIALIWIRRDILRHRNTLPFKSFNCFKSSVIYIYDLLLRMKNLRFVDVFFFVRMKFKNSKFSLPPHIINLVFVTTLCSFLLFIITKIIIVVISLRTVNDIS